MAGSTADAQSRSRSGERDLSASAILNLAERAFARKDPQSVIPLLEEGVAGWPKNRRLQHLLGKAYLLNGSLEQALHHLEQVVAAAPDSLEYRLTLAQALAAFRPAEAIPLLQSVIEAGATLPFAYLQLSSLLFQERRPRDALLICDIGLAVHPDHPEILRNRSKLALMLGDYDEVVPYATQQVRLAPTSAENWNFLGMVLREMGMLAEAVDCGLRACALDQRNATIHFNLSLSLLLAGEYRYGFQEYRWRFDVVKDSAARGTSTFWDGGTLNGARILLWAEQGVGDIIQFVRYIPLVRERGGKVVLLTSSPVVRLMGWLSEEIEIIFDSTLIETRAQCPLLNLPNIFGTTLSTIPPPAALRVPEEAKLPWMERFAQTAGRKVGLVWAGNPMHRNDHNRSLPLSLLRPLLDVPNIQFFSLQVGGSADQIQENGHAGRITDLGPHLTDYAETAAAISCLDLVISVDTSVAHLAGSLNQPVWVMLPFAPDWRWLLNRTDSPWYPSMRLFRQQKPNDWSNVIRDIADCLTRP